MKNKQKKAAALKEIFINMRHNCRHIVESQTEGGFFAFFRRQLVDCQYSID